MRVALSILQKAAPYLDGGEMDSMVREIFIFKFKILNKSCRQNIKIWLKHRFRDKKKTSVCVNFKVFFKISSIKFVQGRIFIWRLDSRRKGQTPDGRARS